ncbi:MAG: GumC family protein, partial [Acetobacteraceae bacterium]|nr:GumC family protein [Acetobacteraceae bacterium]
MPLSTTRNALATPDLPAASSAAVAGARKLLEPAKLAADLWHGRWLILAAAVLFGVLAALGANLVPKRFTAHGTIVIETDRLAPELQGAVNGTASHDPLPWVRTEVQVLRSPALMRAAAEELGLERLPEFNPALRPPGLLERAAAAVEARVSAGPPRFGKARQMEEWEQRQVVLDAFSDALVVTHDNRSLAIDVAFTSHDSELSARAVNALLRHYLAEKASARNSTNREANAALTHRVTEVRGEVEDLERQVRETRARNNLIQLRAGSVGQQQLEELTAALTRARAERAQSEATFQRASALSKTASATGLADFLGTSTISMLREREAEAMRNAAEVTNRYGPGHPDSRRATAEVSAVRSHLRDEARRATAALGAQLQAARQNEAELERQVAEARDTANRAAGLQAELDELQREADARRALYQALLERAERTAVEPQSGHLLLPGARVASEAAPPGLASNTHPALAG